MKIRKWPFWPALAMTWLIAVVVVVEVQKDTIGRSCADYTSACRAPTVALDKLFPH